MSQHYLRTHQAEETWGSQESLMGQMKPQNLSSLFLVPQRLRLTFALFFPKRWGHNPLCECNGLGFCDLLNCRLDAFHCGLLTSLCGSGSGIQKNPKPPPLGWAGAIARKWAGEIDRPGFFVPDGRMPFPVNHGTSSEDSLLQVILRMHLSEPPASLLSHFV